MATHYDTLGVGRGATDDELRRAYLRRARQLHPDRQVGATPDAARRAARDMQDLNEAWRVLGDRGRRSAYDRAMDPPPTRATPTADDVAFVHPPADPDDLGARVLRSIPWLVLAFVLGLIFVFTAFAGGGTGGRREPSGYDLAGKCVTAGAGRPQTVPCGPGVEQVVLVVTRASLCPRDASPVSYGGEWLCLRVVDDAG